MSLLSYAQVSFDMSEHNPDRSNSKRAEMCDYVYRSLLSHVYVSFIIRIRLFWYIKHRPDRSKSKRAEMCDALALKSLREGVAVCGQRSSKVTSIVIWSRKLSSGLTFQKFNNNTHARVPERGCAGVRIEILESHLHAYLIWEIEYWVDFSEILCDAPVLQSLREGLAVFRWKFSKVTSMHIWYGKLSIESTFLKFYAMHSRSSQLARVCRCANRNSQKSPPCIFGMIDWISSRLFRNLMRCTRAPVG